MRNLVCLAILLLDGSAAPVVVVALLRFSWLPAPSYFPAQKGETAWWLGTVSQLRVRMRP